ncbi:MAG: cupin domain-containing protein [Hyphomicrobiaceae bacterium]
MAKPVQRLITGHNAQGRSCFIMEGAAPTVFETRAGGTVVTELWETRETPADNSGTDEVTDHEKRLPPPKGGSLFRIVEYPPDSVRLGLLRDHSGRHDTEREGYVRDFSHARHPGFHKTNSIDYAIVLEGEIHALMDEGERLMKPGDVLVQRGTSHAWSNRTDKPARVAFVLIDAKPAP